MKVLIRISLLLCVLSTGHVYADLEDELAKAFGGMVNVTDPTVHTNQRRGIISGGGIQARTKLVDPSFVTFSPPSFEAGCGGINFYGGSIGFISKAQFETLLRNIASAGVGYAFQLALGAICSDCRNLMNNLQEKIQKLNEHFGNSCQMAQGVVNDTLDAMGHKTKNKASMMTVFSGINDLFTASGEGTTDTIAQARNLPQAAECDFKGNLVWCALKEKNVAGWYANGDNDLLEALMSISGTLVLGKRTTDSAGKPTTPKSAVEGILKIEDLMEGGTIKINKCNSYSTNGCTTVTPTNTNFVGLRTRITDMLLGTSTSPGIIKKFHSDHGASSVLTTAEIALLGNTGPAGSMIRTLSATSPETARTFAYRIAPQLAFQIANEMIQEMFSSVSASASLTDSAYRNELERIMQNSRQRINAESLLLQERYGNLNDSIQLFDNISSHLKLKNYLPQQ